jgi:hypothetical protein
LIGSHYDTSSTYKGVGLLVKNTCPAVHRQGDAENVSPSNVDDQQTPIIAVFSWGSISSYSAVRAT